MANKVKFLAQGGSHGYQTNFNIGANDIVINTRPLAKTEIDTSTLTGIIGAGTLVGEANEVAMANHVHLPFGACNGVGIIGAVLGGGVGNYQGLYGPSIDSVLAIRMVTATGDLIEISADSTGDEKGLWFAMRGAGHSFGLVTSLKIKVYPEINGGMHWTKLLVYPPTPEKMTEVAQITHDMEPCDRSSAFVFITPLPPTGQPGFAVSLWYAGSPAEAKAHFEPFFQAGPVAEIGAPDGITPANMLNTGSDPHSVKGGRKPCTGLTCQKIDPQAIVPVWELYTSFIAQNPDAAKETMVMFQNLPAQIQPGRPESGEEQGVYPFRAYNCHAVAYVHYFDPALDNAVKEYEMQFRKIIGGTAANKKAYVNFASGDETAEDVYGTKGLERLKKIKQVWDPENMFRGCFSLL